MYTGRMEDLRRYTLKSEDVTWCHPTPEQIVGTLQSLLRGSAEPGATALILLPEWTRAHWWPHTAELESLHRIERGARLFTRPGPESEVVVRTPWAYRLFRYRVPPVEREETPAVEEGVVYSLPEEGEWRQPADRRRRLVTFSGRIGGKRVTVLIDSGSTLDLVSTHLAQELGVHASPGGANKVRLADGRLQSCEETLVPLELRIGDHLTSRRFHATALHTFDVILGKQWLAEYNPEVCWRTNEVVIRGGGRVVRLRPSPLPRGFGVVEVVSYTQARRAITRGHDAWVGHLLPPDEMEVLLSVIDEREPWLEEPGTTPPVHPDPRVQRVLRKHLKLFRALSSLPPSDRPKHPILIEPGTAPQYRPAYRLSPEENDEVLKQLEKLLGLGFIRESASPWGAPVLFVRKKSGELRMCVDYRLLNSATIKDRTPLPRIDELLDRIGTARCFSKLDLASGYWQVGIAEEAQPLTAFRTKYGSYEWLVMPFGLTNAPATFQKLMTHALAGLLDTCCLCYLDDILIFSASPEEHIRDLDRTLTRLEEKRLHVQITKCTFAVEEVEFLGHLVGRGVIKPDPAKVTTVKEWPPLQTQRDVRAFLGLAGYYRRFIKGFSRVAAPLHELTRADLSWRWTNKEEAAFTRLKDLLTSQPVLRLPTFDRPFTLTTDASTVAVAGILEQPDDEGVLHPVAYCSRKLNVHESNYSSYDLEALAVVDAVTKHFRCYLEGKPFHLKTDHDALVYLQKQHTLNRRQARWVSELSPYTFTVEYRPGATNPADGPSRRPDYARKLQVEKLQRTTGQTEEALRDLRGSELAKLEGRDVFRFTPLYTPEEVEEPKRKAQRPRRPASPPPVVPPLPSGAPAHEAAINVTVEVKSEAQAENRASVNVTTRARSGTEVGRSPRTTTAVEGVPPPRAPPVPPPEPVPPPTEEEETTPTVEEEPPPVPPLDQESIRRQVRDAYTEDPLYSRDLRSFEKQDGCYFYRGRLAIPTHPTMEPLKNTILKTCHDGMGHFATARTYQEVERHYWWPTLRKDVELYVKTCPTCQRTRLGKEKDQGLLQPLPVPEGPFQVVTLDLISLPKTQAGHDAAVVFVDKFTKYVIVEPCTKEITAPELADLFINAVYAHFGLPHALVSDRDTRFTSNYWQAVFDHVTVKLNLSTPYHPQTDGQTERANRTLISVLRAHALTRSEVWDRTIKVAQAEMNGATNKSTQLSPFEALHAFRPRLLPTLLRELITDVPAARTALEDLAKVRLDIRERLSKVREAMIRQTAPRRKATTFKPGDLVLLSTQVINVPVDLRKLEAPFCGPFKVLEVPSPVKVVLELPERYRNHRRIHVSHIRSYTVDTTFGDRYTPPPATMVNEEEEWDVSGIRAKRVRNGVTEYLVSYTGYDTHEDIWLPEEDLPHCQDLIDEFNATRLPTATRLQRSSRA